MYASCTILTLLVFSLKTNAMIWKPGFNNPHTCFVTFSISTSIHEQADNSLSNGVYHVSDSGKDHEQTPKSAIA